VPFILLVAVILTSSLIYSFSIHLCAPTITTPHFISNHYLVYNNQQDHHHLLVIRAPFRTPDLVALKPYISLFSWNTSQHKGLVSSQIFNPPYEHNNGNIQYWTRIMGPFNGIFCLIGYPNALTM
jgi:hypothetical protein